MSQDLKQKQYQFQYLALFLALPDLRCINRYGPKSLASKEVCDSQLKKRGKKIKKREETHRFRQF